MSRTLRIGVVAEGPTDFEVLQAVIGALLPDNNPVVTLIQPTGSAAFGTLAGTTGEGWGGIYRWCRRIVQDSGNPLSRSPLFPMHDLLIIQIDADVADQRYRQAQIMDPNLTDLPCARPCPPPSDTTDALQRVVMGWMNEAQLPARCVFCTPSKATETWVLAALFPEAREVRKASWECHPDPESQFSTLPKKKKGEGGKKEKIAFRKAVALYRSRRDDIAAAWPRVRQRLAEAERFSTDLERAVRAVGQSESSS